jgi:hypothetical protein
VRVNNKKIKKSGWSAYSKKKNINDFKYLNLQIIL